MEDNLPTINTPPLAVERLNPRQLKFFAQYLKTGEIGKSYAKVYNQKNKTYANILGSKLLSKYKDIKKLFYELNGLGEKDMARVISEALNANKLTFYNKQKYETPDHFIRLKAVEIRNKALGEGDTPAGGKGGPTLNIYINKKKSEGTFEIGDSQEGELV